MKKWVMVFASSAIVLGAGGYGVYQYGMNLAADKISEELEKNPEVMKQIEEEIKNNEKELAQLGEEASSGEKEQGEGEVAKDSPFAGGNESTTGKPADSNTAVKSPAPNPEAEKDSSDKKPPAEKPNSSGGKEFSSRNEAVRFAMSRFSTSEINQVREMAADGLTAQEKAKLKSMAYSKFSAEEIAAVQQAVSN